MAAGARAVCALLFMWLATAPVPADGIDEEFDLRIPAAGAETAIKSLSRQTGYSVIYQSADVEHFETQSLAGRYTLRQALNTLLRDTNLTGGVTGSGVITISRTTSEDDQVEGNAMSSRNARSVFARVSAAVLSVFAAQGAAAQAVPSGQVEGRRVIEEVVVTAQKREQTLQDVGIAVTALSEELLVDRQVGNILDLQGLVPGLTLGESFGFAQIMIRGVGTDNPFAGGDPSVALHVDGAVVGQSGAQLGSFFDLERVEVLRGPQGTLYGRNTTGGSVNLITAKPTETLSGYGRFTAGNHELFQFEGAVAGPLVQDQLLGRLTVRVTDRGGYGKNRLTGDDVDDASRQSVRAQLHWLPTDAVDVLVSGEYHREDDSNYIPKFRAPSYPDTQVPALMPQPLGAVHASNPHDLLADSLIQNERDYWSATGTVNWRLNDRFMLSSITNYQEFERIPQQDFDFSGSNFYTQSEQYETWQLSEELRLHYEGERVNGLVGLYYYRDRIKSDNRLWLNIPVPPCGPPTNDLLSYPIEDLCFHFRGNANAEAWAAFANFNFAVSDTVTINVGGRYSDEKRDGFTDRWVAPGVLVPLTFEDSGSFSDFSARVGVEWKATDDLLLYATYAEGFKAGILLSGQRNPLLDPETVETYEIGLKSRLLGNRLHFNLAGFLYDYEDMQIGRSEPAGAAGFTLVYENAAKAEVKGVELEASWLATEQLRFEGSVTYLDAQFKDFLSRDPFDVVLGLLGIGPPAEPQQLAGNRLVQAPEWAFSLRGEYSFALRNSGWNGTFAAEVMYKDDIFFTPFNHPELGQESVRTVNANLRFTSPDDRWYVNLWGRNLTDEVIYVGNFIINGSRVNAGMLAPPRTFGATLGYNF